MLTPDRRWKQVKDLFELALEQMPGDLDGWLDEQGVTDEQVRAEVLSLLRQHTKTGSFLINPIADRVPDLMADSHPLQPDQVVGKYTIVREIGRGGMGRVYLATDQQLGRQVALKALAPELARDPEHRERLRREALAADSLRGHPGICTVYAFEEIDGNLYIASEFVEGLTLRVEIARGPRPSVDAIRQTALDLARTLGTAHGRGITHRDFKPENVMRTTDGRLKVLDFGLASVAPTASALASIAGTLTVPGAFMGTPVYMAPEQLRGEKADHRTDVFAFGLVLYEYACGVHPFASDQPRDIPARIIASEPTPASRHRRDLPESIVAIITRCLAKPPEGRFPSAAELATALTRLEPEPEPEPAPVADRLTAWWRTHQLAVIALYFTACVLAWQVKEWEPGHATALFMATCIAATIGGVVRGMLLFREKVGSTRLAAASHKTKPWTYAADVIVGSALLVDGAVILGFARPVPAVLTMALGLGIAFARIVIEPDTTADAFAHSESV